MTVQVDGGRGDPSQGAPYTKPPGLVPHSGFVAAVVGSSGKTQDSGGAGFGYPAHVPFPGPGGLRALVECGSLVLDVTRTTLDARFLNDQGVVRDWFRIQKPGEEAPRGAAVDTVRLGGEDQSSHRMHLGPGLAGKCGCGYECGCAAEVDLDVDSPPTPPAPARRSTAHR